MKKNNKKVEMLPDPKKDKKPSPITHKDEVSQSSDNKIDQDFPGFPHAPANEKNIRPQTKNEHLVAGTSKKKGENVKNNSQSEGDEDAVSQTEQSGNESDDQST